MLTSDLRDGVGIDTVPAGLPGGLIGLVGKRGRPPKAAEAASVAGPDDARPTEDHDFGLDPPALVHRNIELTIALAFVLLGLWMFATSFTFRESIITGEMIDETGLPRLVAIFFVAGGTIISIRILRAWRFAPTPHVSSDGGSADLPGYPVEVWRPWVYFGVSVVWTILLPIVGYIVATAALLFVFLFLARVRSVVKLIAVPLGVPLVTWLLFDRVVGITFPAGVIEDFLSQFVPRVF